MDAHVLARQSLEWLAARPPWLSIGVCGSVAFLEYVVPPLPHDVVVVAGGILAARGDFSAIVLLAVVTVGSTIGALSAFAVGKLAGKSERARRFVMRFFTEDSFERMAVRYRKWGRLLIAANRFLPGVRTSLLFGAGLFRMRAVDVAIFGAISAFLWNALLIGAGVLLGQNLDDVITIVERYSFFGWSLVVLVFAALVVRWAVRRHRLRVKKRAAA